MFELIQFLFRLVHRRRHRDRPDSAFVARRGDTVCCCNVRDGHVAVLHAQIYAHKQIPIQAHPFEAPHSHSALRLWSPLQSPARGAHFRYNRRCSFFPHLRNDSSDRHLLLLVRYNQDRG